MRPKNNIYINYFRPVADALVALLLALPALWLMALIALALLLQGKGVLFVQQRQGHHGKLLWLLKFRTIDGGPGHSKAHEAARITAIGALLRKTGLDELPQIFQVITGQLALIGPRPLLPEYHPHFTAQQKQRFAIRPGITGLAQIKGGNALPWPQKLRYDAWYARNASFWLDFYIVVQTFVQLYLPTQPQAHTPSDRFDAMAN